MTLTERRLKTLSEYCDQALTSRLESLRLDIDRAIEAIKPGRYESRGLLQSCIEVTGDLGRREVVREALEMLSAEGEGK